MAHVLDNPGWNALNSLNSEMAIGNRLVKIFQEEIAPFVGLKECNEKSFKALFNLLHGRTAVLITAEKAAIPTYLEIVHQTTILQMICNDVKHLPVNKLNIVPLEKDDVPQMIALTQLTRPGPFLARTIEFGNYTGIYKGDQLVAMAGQRMQPYEYVEISAVCTHPDHLGNGYGTALISNQVNSILAKGSTPFLHVRQDNQNAIKLYRHLGFDIREEMNLYVIKQPDK